MLLREEVAVSATQANVENDIARQELANVLAYHDGDASAAVESLLNDCRNLRHRLAITDSAVSLGFTRGWRPELD